jgi:hypothetical protein
MSRRREEVENSDYVRFARRILRAMGKRVSAGDIDALPELVALRDDLDRTIEETVRSLRSEPWLYSWADIGGVLGVSRQAAQKRWGHLEAVNPRHTGGQPTHLR